MRAPDGRLLYEDESSSENKGAHRRLRRRNALQRRCESLHKFTTILLSCQMRWRGGSEIIGKKCLRGGVGIGNSAGRGVRAGKRYNVTPMVLERLMRAAPSSHKSSSSPGLDHFPLLAVVSAAERLRSLGENNGEARR